MNLDTQNVKLAGPLLMTVFLVSACALPASAHADNIDVQFQTTPLFSSMNMAPGDTVTRAVTVTNTSGSPQNVYVQALKPVNTGGLGDALVLSVTDGSATVYHDTLSHFLTKGPQLLTNALPDGGTSAYNFSVAFDSAAGNQFQNSTLSFDLCVGYRNGPDSQGSCVSDSIINGTDDTSGNQAGSPGSIGIVNPNVNNGGGRSPSGASGGPVSDGSVLGSNTGPHEHAELSGKQPRDSRFTALSAGVAQAAGNLEGLVKGAQTSRGTLQEAAAAALAGFPFWLSPCVTFFLIVMIAAFLIWEAIDRSSRLRKRLLPIVRGRWRIICYVSVVAAGLVIASLFSYPCAVPPLSILLLVLLCILAWRSWKR